ncbi:MAG: hypothetical protein J5645_05695 [Lachnospiraceae bacterium]|nr:hypothetical protein [Lachnospiraceae bacterium]
MRKFLALMLTVVCVVGLLCACGPAKNNTTEETVTPTATSTPAPTNTPTPSPTPTPDPNCFFKCDFDSKPVGQVVDAYEFADAVTGELAYMLFGGVGSGIGDFAAGKGTNGSGALLVTGRTATWNGIALNIDEKYFGKGLKVSFDACATSLKEDEHEMQISCTTKFQITNSSGRVTMLYPQYNRIVVTSVDGAWVHGEGVVYFPSDIIFDPADSGATPQIYFESPTGKGMEDIIIDNVEMTVIDGVGDYTGFKKYWDEHKPAEEE